MIPIFVSKGTEPAGYITEHQASRLRLAQRIHCHRHSRWIVIGSHRDASCTVEQVYVAPMPSMP